MRLKVLWQLCVVVTALQVNVVVASTPSPRFPVEYWRNVKCIEAQDYYQAECRKAHGAMGIEDPPEAPPPAPAPERQPEPKSRVPKADDDVGANAVDVMLANSLKDPTSPIQYQVSRVLPCNLVLPGELRDKAADCICYSVNAKNSYGAYGGSTVAVAELLQAGQSYVALSVSRELLTPANVTACTVNLERRDAELIKRAVR